MNPAVAFPISFGATFLAALLGSAASIQASAFYASLTKPSWAPSAGVFGPVWTVLYLMIALAGGMALSGTGNPRMVGMLFLAQLALNALWSWTFFKWESGAGSMAAIVALWIAIVATTLVFWRTEPKSGALMLPYLGWVTFAAFLNGAMWRLNPGAL